jgi:SNF2 family DNA or RNA helicase
VKYKFKTKPYAHQKEGIYFVFKQWRQGLGAALLFEPRTGKTKTAIDCLSILYHKAGVRKILVVAPNRVLGTWVEEFHIHCPLMVQTIIWDKDARKVPLPKTMGPYDLQVVITNFETFSTPGRRIRGRRRSKANGRFKHRTLIRNWLGRDYAAAVIDEGHKIKSPSGKAANMIVSMRDDFEYRLLLTGTPITKARRAHDIYMLWQWVNPDRFASWGATVEAFKNHVGVWTQKHGFPQWLKARDAGMKDLQKGIHADGMVVRREDCFDLPERRDRILPVPFTPAAAKHYEEMAEQMVTQLKSGKIAEASIPLVVTLRLLQMTSGYVGITEKRGGKRVSVPHTISTEKIKALEELLVEEVIEREEKVVIAARFKYDLTRIERLCKRLQMPVWAIRGGVSRSDTDRAIRSFRMHSDGPAAMVMQPSAGSLGIDLSTASHMVWYSMTHSWVDWTQACDRIALSKLPTTFTYLQVPDTVDSLVYEALMNDTDVSRMILSNPDRLLLRRK